jgi:hypothetical protein
MLKKLFDHLNIVTNFKKNGDKILNLKFYLNIDDW